MDPPSHIEQVDSFFSSFLKELSMLVIVCFVQMLWIKILKLRSDMHLKYLQ